MVNDDSTRRDRRPATTEARRRVVRSAGVIGTAAIALVIAACGGETTESTPTNTREPETAAASPEQATTPAGTVAPAGLGGPTTVRSLAVDPQTSVVAVLTDGGLLLADGSTDGAVAGTPRAVELPSPGTSVHPGRAGEILVTTADGLVRVDAESGAATALPVDGGAISATVFGDGYAVGSATGLVSVLDADGAVTSSIGGLASVDGLVPAGDDLVALDTRQTSVTTVNVAADRLGEALRAGDGATRTVGCATGAIVVSDTADDELMIFTGDDLIMRQRYPVAGSPFAVACDDAGTVWVTTTATNEVLGFDVSSGIPVETARFPTVTQPDSLAVDSRSGRLFVGSNDGAGVQVIPTRE